MGSCLRILSKYGEKEKEALVMKNGAILLEELITSSDGKYNPFCIFSIKGLKKATNNFSYPLNAIKEDAFYILYKGSLHERSISVMKFKDDVRDAKQFCFNNIVFAAQMNHKNVVKLIGCCLETQIPILVFESVVYKTLSYCIRNDDGSQCYEWARRLKIAMEIANAVAYLHVGFTRPIVSKSIKLANILFDEECVAKLFDFTLSEVIPEGETHINNGVVRATMGHIAPEYAYTGDFNEKSDVYSFGILLLRLLTGQSASKILVGSKTQDEDLQYSSGTEDEVSGTQDPLELANFQLLRNFVNKLNEDNWFIEAVDSIIVGDGLCPEIEQQLKVCMELAVKCLSYSGEDRPTMIDAAKQLRQLYLSNS